MESCYTYKVFMYALNFYPILEMNHAVPFQFDNRRQSPVFLNNVYNYLSFIFTTTVYSPSFRALENVYHTIYASFCLYPRDILQLGELPIIFIYNVRKSNCYYLI